MTSKSEELRPLKELEAEANKALKLAWERLGAEDMTDEELLAMVKAWRLKRRIHDRKELEKQTRKEAKQSDAGE